MLMVRKVLASSYTFVEWSRCVTYSVIDQEHAALVVCLVVRALF